MKWQPTIGNRLPRSCDAWCEPGKMRNWVLAAPGHGEEWGRVFHVGSEDGDLVWKAIAAAVPTAEITEVRAGPFGVTCAARVTLTILGRAAPVVTAWHYADRLAAPRLVTAYPTPYNRSDDGNG